MAKTYEQIASFTATGGESSVTFSSIAPDWTDLIVQVNSRQNTGPYVQRIRLNGDTGTTYSFTWLYGDGSSVGSGRAANESGGPWIAYYGAPSSTAPQITTVQIMSYANTSVYKTMLTASGGPAYGVERFVQLWRNTAAVTSVTILPTGASPSYTAGSTFKLYGLVG